MTAGAKMVMTCGYGCKVKLTEVLVDVVNEDGSISLDIDTEAYLLAINAHMRGMHA